MEKTSRRLRPPQPSSAASILSFLPNRASFSHLPHHPHSPGRDAIKHLQRRGFSGPMVSIVPVEARFRKQRFEPAAPEEPTSPKVTCMGQVKLRKMAARCSSKQKPPADDRRRRVPERTRAAGPALIRRIFRHRKAKAAAADGGGGSSENVAVAAAPARAPLLGQMRRFTSGRESLGEFDWRKAASAGEEDSEEEEEEEVLVPHSAPLTMGSGVSAAAGEPRKEVNIWKRRTLPPPKPLQLN